MSGRVLTITVREAGGRLLVDWRHGTVGQRAMLYDAFRSAFPQHKQAVWRTVERCWSLPLARRGDLAAWCSRQYGVRVCWQVETEQEQSQDRAG